MNQNEMRELEHRCTQEQPPYCMAACPIHVDARAMLGQVRAGQLDAARKTLDRTMPFPGILGRLCHQPCREACIRKERGGALNIGGIEKMLVTVVSSRSMIMSLPAKGLKAAIIGAGLAGLTAAWDLGRKGFGVTMLVPGEGLGADLRQLPTDVLPPAELNEAGRLLGKVGVTAQTNVSLDAGLPDALLADHVAVFLDLGDPLVRSAYPTCCSTDAVCLLSDRERIFCGGADADGPKPYIFQVADGRRAVLSIERLAQGASLSLNREAEGPYATRLHTSLDGVLDAPEIAPGQPSGYAKDEAVREAARCLACECMECVKACTYLRTYKGYPKKYVRQIYNNAAIVKGHHQANRFINSCSLCGQCTVICPNDFPYAEMCLTMREDMLAREKMPPSAHEFALEDMAFNQSEMFSLARHAPDRTRSDLSFFPGCQLAASKPDTVKAVYAWLRRTLGTVRGRRGDVGLILGCCGVPALWAGRRDLFNQALDRLRADLASLGNPILIPACAACADTLATHAPDIRQCHLLEILDESGKIPACADTPTVVPLAVHDPCTARHHPGLRQAARNLLTRAGQPVEELRLSGELTSCCGYGGLMSCANPDLADQVTADRAAESPLNYAAYCAMCRDRLAASGKRAVHVLDLYFPDAAGPDPAGQPSPGFSQRHENRARLRRNLLSELWGESAPVEEEAIRLEIPPDVAPVLERRRILVEDIRKVLARAEASGRRFRNPATGRFLACLRPVRVTYWVEYEIEDGTYIIRNAYSHRMVLPEDQA